MAPDTTPHTQTQQDRSATEADLGRDERAEDAARNDEAMYQNMDGAQTGGTRAFNANTDDNNLPNAEEQTAALGGRPDTRLPHGVQQGVTSHSASEESARNQKVVDERADAQAGGGQ